MAGRQTSGETSDVTSGSELVFDILTSHFFILFLFFKECWLHCRGDADSATTLG